MIWIKIINIGITKHEFENMQRFSNNFINLRISMLESNAIHYHTDKGIPSLVARADGFPHRHCRYKFHSQPRKSIINDMKRIPL